MGGITTHPTELGNFNRQNWVTFPSSSKQLSAERISQNTFIHSTSSSSSIYCNNTKRSFSDHILKKPIHLVNKFTGEELIEYEIVIYEEDQYLENLDYFAFRQKNREFIIAPKNYAVETKHEICIKSYLISLYIQNIPLRLSQITQIPLQDSLYVMKAALKGFGLLYQKIGYFPITEQLIGITAQGVVKVWISDDYSKNQPIIKRYSPNYKQQNQKDIILEILKILQQKTVMSSSIDHQLSKSSVSTKNSLPTFYQIIKAKKSYVNQVNFDNILDELFKYAESIKIKVPQYYVSALKRLRVDKGIYQSQVSNNKFINFDQLKQSSVRPFKLETFKLRHGVYKQSFIQSQSSQTYADQLNSAVSGIKNKNRNNKQNSGQSPSILQSFMKSGEKNEKKSPSDSYFAKYLNQSSGIKPMSNERIQEVQESLITDRGSQYSKCIPNLSSRIHPGVNQQDEGIKNYPQKLRASIPNSINQSQKSRIKFTYHSHQISEKIPCHSICYQPNNYDTNVSTSDDFYKFSLKNSEKIEKLEIEKIKKKQNNFMSSQIIEESSCQFSSFNIPHRKQVDSSQRSSVVTTNKNIFQQNLELFVANNNYEKYNGYDVQIDPQILADLKLYQASLKNESPLSLI